MKKADRARISGVLLVALAIVLRQFAVSGLSSFLQGFCIGLGLCLLAASFFRARGKVAGQKA